jgi:exodeoxyribonuclease V beta subunit
MGGTSVRDNPAGFDPLDMPLAGVQSIAASAGTGKTHAITTLYLRYLVETDCRVEDILVTTFTEAATAELRERLRKRLHDALELLGQCADQEQALRLVEAKMADGVIVDLLFRAGAWNLDTAPRVQNCLRQAILNFDHAPVFTIHGFCNRVLQELVFETLSRFDVELVASQQSLLDEAVADFVAQWWTAEESAIARWIPLDEDLWDLFHEVGSLAVANPASAIVPGDGDLEKLLKSPLMGEFDDAAGRMADAWVKNRKAALELVLKARANDWLNGNTHGRPGQLEEACDFIDALVADQSPDLFQMKGEEDVQPAQRRLTQSSLEKGTKKAYKDHAPHHEVFRLWEDVVSLAIEIHQYRATIRPPLLSRLARVAREYVQHRQQQLGVMSFGDLLHQVDTALAGSQRGLLLARLRERYRVALVDEFQDTDPVQYRIFRRIFQEASGGTAGKLRAFVMIGDPKQSIYRFRGADIHSYLRATEATPPDNRHSMGTNWRSDRSLVLAVQAVMASAKDPFLNKKIHLTEMGAAHADRLSAGPALEIAFVPRHPQAAVDEAPSQDLALKQVVPRVAADIVAQLNDPPQIEADDGRERAVIPADLAVLCRTGRQLQMIQAELARRGVPAVLQTEESIFDTAEATVASHLLRALLNPGNSTLLANALATPLVGLTAGEMEILRRDERAMSQWGDKFYQWRDLWRARGFIVLWRRLLDDLNALPRLAHRITGERQVTNYLHLGELLHGQAVQAHAGPEHLLRWLEKQILHEKWRDDNQTQLRLETDAAAVQLCTIHKSKGLEYPIVYCPTLWHSYGGPQSPVVLARFDHQGQPLEIPEIDVGSAATDARLEADATENQAEGRRLLYVTLTRGKHQCRIYWAAAKRASDSALGQIMFDRLAGTESDEQLEAAIRSWVKRLGADRVEVRGAPAVRALADPGMFQPRTGAPATLSSRPITRPTLSILAQTSFSALTRAAAETAELGIADRDEQPPTEGPAVETEEVVPAADRQVPLAEMPGGAKVGNAVHEVLEQLLGGGTLHGCDRLTVQAAATKLLESQLPRVGLEPHWQEPLAAVLANCLTTPIAADGQACQLLAVPPRELACEMPFLLSVAGRDHDIALARVGDAFLLSHCPLIREYGKRVQQTQRGRLRGFLGGFIDLVFRWQGKWYLLDYKTNRLGPRRSDYSPARLGRVMVEHDYQLQAHLYVVATDRLLRQRMPDYQYEHDFGGVIYLFLRGFDPAGDTGCGVYFHRPGEAVVAALSAALGGSVGEKVA